MEIIWGRIALFVIFIGAPLILFSYVVAQERRRQLVASWFTGITALLTVGLIIAVLAILQA